MSGPSPFQQGVAAAQDAHDGLHTIREWDIASTAARAGSEAGFRHAMLQQTAPLRNANILGYLLCAALSYLLGGGVAFAMMSHWGCWR